MYIKLNGVIYAQAATYISGKAGELAAQESKEGLLATEVIKARLS